MFQDDIRTLPTTPDQGQNQALTDLLPRVHADPTKKGAIAHVSRQVATRSPGAGGAWVQGYLAHKKFQPP